MLNSAKGREYISTKLSKVSISVQPWSDWAFTIKLYVPVFWKQCSKDVFVYKLLSPSMEDSIWFTKPLLIEAEASKLIH